MTFHYPKTGIFSLILNNFIYFRHILNFYKKEKWPSHRGKKG